MWRALRIACIECTLKEYKTGTYYDGVTTWPSLGGSDLNHDKYPIVDAYVTSLEAETKTRYDRVDSKLRTLLSANAIAFGLIGGFATAKQIILLATAPLLFSLLLAMRGLGVQNFASLSLNDEALALSADLLRAAVVRDRIAAANQNAKAIDFLVDCMRGAHRFFAVGLVAVPSCFLFGLLLSAPLPTRVSVVQLDGMHITAQPRPSSTASESPSSQAISLASGVPQAPPVEASPSALPAASRAEQLSAVRAPVNSSASAAKPEDAGTR